ncbi:hypothetical protein Tdes44962_MAKER02258 [Teratosphaeria destructans]|uniref:Uncharacterized protein n=1 Tax=Teratosphaeria destructans TaxID=418781 RepID=A0A9W7SUH2_9PEZI|nr:hypothetical protein Tdes44962_MAKER02258 [Teratosphaeria destructans]
MKVAIALLIARPFIIAKIAVITITQAHRVAPQIRPVTSIAEITIQQYVDESLLGQFFNELATEAVTCLALPRAGADVTYVVDVSGCLMMGGR